MLCFLIIKLNNSNYVLFDFRPLTPASQSNAPSHRMRNLPCRDISNRDVSSSISASRRAKCNTDDIKQNSIIEKGSPASVRSVGQTEVHKSGRQRARRSLHYDDNENIIDDATTEYVLSRKRPPSSPESLTTEQPRKRSRTEEEACVLESLEDEFLEARDTEITRRSSRKLSIVTIGRKSGQWEVSTPTRERTLTPRKNENSLLDTPSKSVKFHESVIGGDSDDGSAAETQSPRGTPRSARRTQKLSMTEKCESLVQALRSGGKSTPRARNSLCLTPKSSQKGTPGKSAEAVSTSDTPRRSSARIASASSQQGSCPRRGNKATPRTSDKKQKDLPVRRLLSASSPSTGRVLRPRTPRSYKFSAVRDDDSDFYDPDVESSDEEDLDVKKTPKRKATKEVHNFIICTYSFKDNYRFRSAT